MELRSRQLRSYGELDDDTAAILDERSRRLGELVTELMSELERARRRHAV
jgi:hypothetical protein